MAVDSKYGVSRIDIGGNIQIGAEILTTSTTAGSIAGQHSATIPSGTSRIFLIPITTTHYWHPTGTASSTHGYSQADAKGFFLEPGQHGASVVAASGTPSLLAIYFGYPV